MFKDVVSEKGLRKLNKIGGRLEKRTIQLPSNTEVVKCIKELENRLNGEGRVQYDYAKRTIIGYEYAIKHHHYKTNNLMLDDINNDKNLHINSYI